MVISFCTWFIYLELINYKQDESIIENLYNILYTPLNAYYLLFSLLLMPVNWIIESYKWKFLIGKASIISLQQAFKAVITGVTFSIFTPNRIGEFAGRVFYLEPGQRITGTLITIVGSMSQLIVTIIAGAAGMVFFILNFLGNSTYLQYSIIFLIIILTFVILLLFLNLPDVFRFFKKNRIFKPLLKYAETLDRFSSMELLTVLNFSLLRYFIFSLQFYLLLQIFEVRINVIDSLMFISMTFLSIAAIPTGILTDIGIREIISLHFFSMASENKLGIVTATFSLWLINLAIPAIAGIFFVLRLKLFKK